MTTILNLLSQVIPGAFASRPRNRLPRGRCACHEPTVKWCTRHGQPIKLPHS
jgi:hypothetical protein